MDNLTNEERIKLAIDSYKKGQFKSATSAAKAFDAPKDTVLRRLRGTHPQLGSVAINRLLTPNKE